ncbi:hypothetical protein GCM10025770_38120 [Viridibacterium curvum]|uniref:Pectate lyase domain-containing protein n=1 Tax=Viridibacterium curvum TaxID=1101404 RepID=A0ABP9R699_9RHOO
MPAGVTGGGVIPETDPGYRKVTTALELAQAIVAANKIDPGKTGRAYVIEIMNDLDLGWNEIGSAAQTLASTPFSKHANTPKLHPKLIASDVSNLQISPKKGGLTIFSANGATIRHSSWSIKATSNVIIRNLKFDELWEWDEDTKGDYDKNNWDFIVIGVGGGRVSHIWIDHCTFSNAYDGIIDTKGGTSNVTYSWNAYVGDDGVANAFNPTANLNSFVWQQINKLEENKDSYPLYSTLRNKMLLTPEQIVQVMQGTKKTMAIGELSKDVVNQMSSVTLHHNLYLNPVDRLPRSAGAQVHSYNNYADATNLLAAKRMRDAKFAAMSSADQAKFTSDNPYKFGPSLNGSISVEDGAMLVEKSVYIDVLWPLRNNQTNPADASYTGKILGLDLQYIFHNEDGTTYTERGDSTATGSRLGPFQDSRIKPFAWNTTHGGAPYTLPASAYDDPASLLPVIQAGVGAGRLTWAKENWLKVKY